MSSEYPLNLPTEQIAKPVTGSGDPDFAGDRAVVAAKPMRPEIAAAATAAHTGRLTATGFTAEEVAAGLPISATEVDRMRLARELWAIPDNTSWRYPAAQFDIDPQSHQPTRQVPGLAQVLVALPADMHPVSVDGFLRTTQPDLMRDREHTPLEWLRGGGQIDAAIRAATVSDWYSR